MLVSRKCISTKNTNTQLKLTGREISGTKTGNHLFFKSFAQQKLAIPLLTTYRPGRIPRGLKEFPSDEELDMPLCVCEDYIATISSESELLLYSIYDPSTPIRRELLSRFLQVQSSFNKWNLYKFSVNNCGDVLVQFVDAWKRTQVIVFYDQHKCANFFLQGIVSNPQDIDCVRLVGDNLFSINDKWLTINELNGRNSTAPVFTFSDITLLNMTRKLCTSSDFFYVVVRLKKGEFRFKSDLQVFFYEITQNNHQNFYIDPEQYPNHTFATLQIDTANLNGTELIVSYRDGTQNGFLFIHLLSKKLSFVPIETGTMNSAEFKSATIDTEENLNNHHICFIKRSTNLLGIYHFNRLDKKTTLLLTIDSSWNEGKALNSINMFIAKDELIVTYKTPSAATAPDQCSEMQLITRIFSLSPKLTAENTLQASVSRAEYTSTHAYTNKHQVIATQKGIEVSKFLHIAKEEESSTPRLTRCGF